MYLIFSSQKFYVEIYSLNVLRNILQNIHGNVLIVQNIFEFTSQKYGYKSLENGEWESYPNIPIEMIYFWLKIKNNPDELIKANYLWWKTPGSNWRQNIFFDSQYTRDGILNENPNAKKLIELNKYIITIDSQDNSRCEKNYVLQHHFDDKPGKRIGDKVNIVAIPYIEFLIPKNISKKLINKMDQIDDCLVISSGGIKYFNKTLLKRIKYGPAWEQEYSYLSGTEDPYLNISPNGQFEFVIENITRFNSIPAWYREITDRFEEVLDNFDIGYIMSNAMATKTTCSPDDDIYQRLLDMIIQ
jgi:hypothetical protein